MDVELLFDQAEKLGIFGSYVRGEQNSNSDVDILVSFKELVGLLKFVALKHQLGELIGKDVDLVMKSALQPGIGKRILKEVIYV
ncbi:MAG TPA: nucleotidyltransferase family protein [Syntrophomonadaceae bacterium]|nr:nucleotidyltransferase family protein [Syntrophomonadaceae bacterium]